MSGQNGGHIYLSVRPAKVSMGGNKEVQSGRKGVTCSTVYQFKEKEPVEGKVVDSIDI